MFTKAIQHYEIEKARPKNEPKEPGQVKPALVPPHIQGYWIGSGDQKQLVLRQVGWYGKGGATVPPNLNEVVYITPVR